MFIHGKFIHRDTQVDVSPQVVILYPLHLASLEALEKLQTVGLCFVRDFLLQGAETHSEKLKETGG